MLYKGKSLSCTKRSIGIHNVFVVFVTTKSGDFAERHGTIEHLEELGLKVFVTLAPWFF